MRIANNVYILSLSILSLGMIAANAEEPFISLPRHQLPISKTGNLVVEACDGKTAIEVPNKKEGEKLTHTEAKEISAKLMEDWQSKNPSAHWVMVAEEKSGEDKLGEEKKEQAPAASDVVSAVGNADKNTLQQKQQQGIYSDFTKEDQKTWEIEQAKLIADGKAIFHSADRLKSKTAISCDMCHPNAANTHPETYPKYQVQLQRVAMLRDMINWCIENPVKGVMLRDDDPNMRALEAYIISQRMGTPLSPGKH